ncbi:hypothetical protein [Nannocystis pusilla]|uniref:hypothetical protein n=1 Tax=Nannocystis pusilla TaxID=889268 RepID=UPI003B8132F3
MARTPGALALLAALLGPASGCDRTATEPAPAQPASPAPPAPAQAEPPAPASTDLPEKTAPASAPVSPPEAAARPLYYDGELTPQTSPAGPCASSR